MSQYKDFLIRIKAKGDDFAKGFKRAAGVAKAQMRKIKDQVFSLKGAFLALGGGLLAKSFLDNASAFEKFRLQLETIEGSSKKAGESFDWIKTFAKDTPYELDEITASFVKLKAYGIDPVDGTMKTLGDTAGSMGKSLDQAVEALADATTGEFERLKEFGVTARVTGDQVAFNYTKNGKQMVATADKNSRAMIQSTLTAIWNEKYAGGMAKQSSSWSGIWSNIKDKWTQIQTNIMDGGLFNYFKAIASVILDGTGNALEQSKQHAVAWSNTFIDGIETIIKGAGYMSVAFRAFEIIFKGLEISWVGFKLGVLSGAAEIEEGVLSIRRILGEKISGTGPLQMWANDTRKEVELLNDEFIKLSTKELKTDGGEQLLERIRAKFTEITAAAKETTEASNDAASASTNGIGKAVTAQVSASDKLISSLREELRLMKLSEKERFIEQQSRKLGADATDEQRLAVQRLANEMYELEEAGKASTDELVDAIHGFGKAFTDTMTDMVVDGKGSFSDLADSIVRDLVRIAIQKTITDQIVGAASTYFSGMFHSGGVVGSGGGTMAVSPSVFAGAPRYHTGGIAGLKPYERPAILKLGEEVLTEDDPRHVRNGGGGGRGSFPVSISLHNESGQQMETSSASGSFDGEKLMISAVIKDVSNGGALDGLLQRQYSLTRST